MDGKGRCMDNIFVERLWRSLKYEEVYLHAYASVAEAKAGIGAWLDFYNGSASTRAWAIATPRQAYEVQCRWTCGDQEEDKARPLPSQPERRSRDQNRPGHTLKAGSGSHDRGPPLSGCPRTSEAAPISWSVYPEASGACPVM